MKFNKIFLPFIALLVLVSAVQAQALEVGDMAPTFKLEASDGNTYDLGFFRGKRAVVLAWFPKAYTSGCTIECKSLARKGHLIREYDAAYFMASVDTVEDNTGFAEKTRADFPLLSDSDKQVAKAYGVLTEEGYAARQTFYIGIDGKILKIDDAVNPETSAEDIAENLKTLGVAVRVTP